MDTKPKKWKDMTRKEKVVGVIVLYLIAMFTFKIINGIGKQKPAPQNGTEQAQAEATPTPTPREREPEAKVKFNEVAFQITNNEDIKWTDCRLSLNSKYTFSTSDIPPQEPIVIPFNEFTKGDGTRFNPYSTKAQNLSISCEGNGQHLFGYYEIK